jgi:hypothetical protein
MGPAPLSSKRVPTQAPRSVISSANFSKISTKRNNIRLYKYHLHQSSVLDSFRANFYERPERPPAWESTMRVGVPTEIKVHEYRVGLTPNGARELTAHGHEVVVQKGAGVGAGFTDEQYVDAGATILPDAAAVFEAAEMIVKVKEPQPSETAMLTADHVLFTYLHLAPDPVQAEGCANRAAPRSPMKRSPTAMAACLCCARCQRSLAG